jgi:hypothetical protein
MRYLFLSSILLQLVITSGMAGDSLAVFEIKSTGNLVRSAQVSIPANTLVNIGFESNNTNNAITFNQGVLVDFGGGAVAVKYQDPPWLQYGQTNGYATRSFPNAARDPAFAFASPGVMGPCTITFFCQSAAVRGSIYSKSDSKYASYWTSVLIKPSSSKLTVNIPQNYMGDMLEERYGSQFPSWTKKTGLNNTFVYSNQYSGFTTPGFYGASVTSSISSVVTWSTVPETKSYRTVNGRFLGSMTVDVSYTNKSDTNNFAFIRYYISPANYSYNTTSGVNVVKDEANPNTKNVRLVFEKSTDNKNWLPADSMYVTETSGQAFYRIRNEEF